jgi:hypothetical protein
MKAFVERAPVDADGRPVEVPRGPAVGVRSRYLTRSGITVFLLETEPVVGDPGRRRPGLEAAQPGMVGVSRCGDVYLVDDEGQARQLTTRLVGVHDYERALSIKAP